MDMQNGTVTWEDSSAAYKMKHYSSFNPTTTLLSIYPNDVKTVSTQKPARRCSQQLYSQLPKLGSSQGVRR